MVAAVPGPRHPLRVRSTYSSNALTRSAAAARASHASRITACIGCRRKASISDIGTCRDLALAELVVFVVVVAGSSRISFGHPDSRPAPCQVAHLVRARAATAITAIFDPDHRRKSERWIVRPAPEAHVGHAAELPAHLRVRHERVDVGLLNVGFGHRLCELLVKNCSPQTSRAPGHSHRAKYGICRGVICRLQKRG